MDTEETLTIARVVREVDDRLRIRDPSYVLVRHLGDGGYHLEVEAIFTHYGDAVTYRHRLVTNFALSLYLDDVHERQVSIETEDFCQFVDELVREYYEILLIDHLDLTQPVYCLADRDHYCRGHPRQYLTHAIDETHFERYLGFDLVDINPVKPDLNYN